MAAGGSAAAFAREAQRTARALSQVLDSLETDARNFTIAARSEAELDRALRPIESSGYTILADRRWPGGTRSQVDFVVVGPAGVFIVDAKEWSNVALVETDGVIRVYQDQDDVTDRFENLSRLANECRRDLADLGLPAGEIHAIAVFTNRNDLRGTVNGVEILSLRDAARFITGRHDRLDPDHVALVLKGVEAHFPPYSVSEDLAREALPLIAGALALDEVIPTDLADDALFSIDEVNDILIEGMMREPIESWMSFLHPEQARIIRRSFSGPSRIRGAAGTGKTVVGLHRAAHLARTLPGKVLVTTYIKTLPVVLSSLMRRMAPDVADRIEFMSVDSFASRTLRLAGITSRLDPDAAEQAWSRAWLTAGKPSGLREVDKNPGYWQDEVLKVIKGRGLTSLDEYRDCSRAGRTRRLTAVNKADVWNLFETYQEELAKRRAWDFQDVVNNAAAVVTRAHGAGYSAVVVDEAQDLTCSMVRMLHSLVGDGPDALNLIGDGQQSVYTGGYTLAEIGISISGRGVVMSRNYRNTAEIASFASSLIAGDTFADIEGGLDTRDVAEFTRQGVKPIVLEFHSPVAHDERLVGRIRHLIADGTAELGDFGVLALHRRDVNAVTRSLTAAGIPTVDLDRYDGERIAAVKIGTVKRAKGLEFKQVLVARAPKAMLTPVPRTQADAEGSNSDGTAELTRRELYVAMTRARDGLWVGVA